MSKIREAYRRFARALLKRALWEKDFGFVDSPLGQLALAMLDDGNAVLEAFRHAEDAGESARKTRRRAARTRLPWPQYHGKWI